MPIVCDENGLSVSFDKNKERWFYSIGGEKYPIDEEGPSSVSLLPLLRIRYSDFQQNLSQYLRNECKTTMLDASFPYNNILRVALSVQSEGWISLALKWIEDSNYSIGESSIEDFRRIGSIKYYSQKIRHRAIRASARLAGKK